MGHFEWLRAFKELGFFLDKALTVGDQQIIPRDVFHTLLEPKISAEHIEDVCVMHVVGKGLIDDKESIVTFDLIDYHAQATGY